MFGRKRRQRTPFVSTETRSYVVDDGGRLHADIGDCDPMVLTIVAEAFRQVADNLDNAAASAAGEVIHEYADDGCYTLGDIESA